MNEIGYITHFITHAIFIMSKVSQHLKFKNLKQFIIYRYTSTGIYAIAYLSIMFKTSIPYHTYYHSTVARRSLFTNLFLYVFPKIYIFIFKFVLFPKIVSVFVDIYVEYVLKNSIKILFTLFAKIAIWI